MDLFTEQMVTKERDRSDNLKRMLCVLGAMGCCVVVPGIFERFIGVFSYAICIAVIFVFYHFMISLNVEYEYTFTNGALDIDKIIATKRRKTIAALNAREIEIMASKRNSEFNRYLKDNNIKKVYACSSLEDRDVYFVIYSDNGTKTMLIFNPNETIRDGFKRLNPQKVFVD